MNKPSCFSGHCRLIGVLLALAFFLPSPALAADGADTKRILDIFENISQVPRCSKNEERISAWLVQWAKERNLAVKSDAANNVLISVPASPGLEDSPAVALQAHMDMVCQKTADAGHDFSTDPIHLVRDGDWLHAKDTTLGADDGIGMAIALFLAEARGLRRPAMELLFTTDEEVDMSGAERLSTDALSAKRFINIDSEVEGEVTLGAAGGVKMELSLPLTFLPLEPAQDVYSLRVDGLLGGHSGVEIHKNRANANVLIARALDKAVPFRLISFAGGSADNAITTASELVLALAPVHENALKAKIAAFEQQARAEYPEETGLSLSLKPVHQMPGQAFSQALSQEDSSKALDLVLAIPQGVIEWSDQFPGLPEISNNIGIVQTRESTLDLVVFHRSFNPDKLEKLAQGIEQASASAGAAASRRSAFPAWPPDSDSELYQKAMAAYELTFGSELKTVVLHAGLECGFIAEKYPEMEIISIGPTLEFVHTPKERLYMPSVERIALFLRALLQDLGE